MLEGTAGSERIFLRVIGGTGTVGLFLVRNRNQGIRISCFTEGV
jgi:hypothetical protein